ncbi:MAG TPA: nucleotidyltransferase domain-containing protein [Firmicutes bacterium]|nr:nucleotidyltransferase domain-containing protein [Bacillota bacterium]
MPVKSLNSSVLKWPKRQEIFDVLSHWVQKTINSRSDIQKIGYFGSFARNDWGPGSDLDLIVIVNDAVEPFGRRSLGRDVLELPVSVDLLIFTMDEWRRHEKMNSRFYKTIQNEVVWIYEAG